MENHKIQSKEKEKQKPLSNSFYIKLYVLLGVVLILFSLYNIAQTSSFGSTYSEELAKAKEAARPAIIELTTIKDSQCNDCFDINPIIDSIKKSNVNITKEKVLELRSSEAQQLIEKYAIDKIPTIIVTGELDKANIKDLEKKDNALLLTQLAPPYTDAKTNKISGLVSTTILKDSSCSNCIDLSQVINTLKQAGVKIVSEEIIEKNTAKGKALIDNYNLNVLPALIISQDLEVYGQSVTQGWGSIGTKEQDGSYITRISPPPYVNLTTNKIEGIVSMTVLTDNTCENCYNPDNFHKPILEKMGVVLENEKRIDISTSEGQSLINKYKIKKVPTIILEGDVEKYPILVEAWADVGSVETDGIYVFRTVELAQQTYLDLTTNQIIEPTTTS